ncbi:hypothetical protein AB1K91_12990 [Terribacillus sp. 179-K 1B1 HS]|uniref:hypothetical protein n=1 Tax=Terribacillus sp. 179-K 1B1 HS TaxID=3142388 RepID=UPI00399FEDB9
MVWKIAALISIMLFYLLSSIFFLYRNNIHLFLYSTIFIPYLVLLPITCFGIWASIKTCLERQWKTLAICAGVALGSGICFSFTASDVMDIGHYANKSFETARGTVTYISDGEDYKNIGQTIGIESKDGNEQYESFQYLYDQDMTGQTVQITYLPETQYILSLIVLE